MVIGATTATYCVLGVAGGGLSLTTAALAALGIPFGERPDGTDDRTEILAERDGAAELGDSAEIDDAVEAIAGLAALVDAETSVWGLCDPLAMRYADRLLPRLRDARIVAAFGDPQTVAVARARLTGRRPSEELATVLASYDRILDLADTIGRPYLLISLDKAVLKPDDCVDALARFITATSGFRPVAENVTAATDLVGRHAPGGGAAALDPVAVRSALAAPPAAGGLS